MPLYGVTFFRILVDIIQGTIPENTTLYPNSIPKEISFLSLISAY